jgi:hypothetical protein
VNTATEQPRPNDLLRDESQPFKPLFYANVARRWHWRKKLETFKAVQGVRAVLDHVSEERWAQHYAANEDAFDAVVAELEKIEV